MTINKREETNRINSIITKLFKNKNINSVHLFGSFLSGKMTPLSDIDLCIDGNLSFDEKVKIKSFFPECYDVTFMDDLYPWVKIQVFKNGKILFVRKKDRLYSQAFRAIKQYEEVEHILKRRTIEKFGTWQI